MTEFENETSAYTIDRLTKEIGQLRATIAKHYADRGHDRCWENDQELYRAAGLSPLIPVLPPIEEHRRECDRYRAGLYGQPESHAEETERLHAQLAEANAARERADAGAAVYRRELALLVKMQLVGGRDGIIHDLLASENVGQPLLDEVQRLARLIQPLSEALNRVTQVLEFNDIAWGYEGTDKRLSVGDALVQVFAQIKLYKRQIELLKTGATTTEVQT